jgi:hypothetical protein
LRGLRRLAQGRPMPNSRILNKMYSYKGVSNMCNRFRVSMVILAAGLLFGSLAFTENARPQQSGATKTPKAASPSAPAPRHDLSGTWEPRNGPGDGIQANGVKAMPNDGKPEHQLPYTPYGLQLFKSHHALEGADAVLPGFYDDPRDKCEPMGFPRAMFYNLRETQILQNDYKIAILYQYATTWRVIWTDGRPLPKLVDGGVMIGNEVREPRYYGYSVAKWMDDTTLVVQTVGMMGEDRVWLDTAGRPISDQLRVEERLHRVDRDNLEWSVTIDDPKIYTKPWVAMDKFPMRLEDPHADVMEQYCSPIEMEKYNKLFGNPSSGAGAKAPER